MNIRELSQLILYIVDQVKELGGYTVTIRLVKFLYLIDLEHWRRYGRTLTGLQWVFHLYGPYAFELPALGDRLGYNLGREEFETTKKQRGTLFSVSEPQEPPAGLSFGAEVIIKGILRAWALQETDDLLQYVYRTEPMRHANQGDKLDFSIVPRGTRYYQLHTPIQREVIDNLRESLRSYSLDDAEEFVRPTTVHDEFLARGLNSLNDDEFPLPDYSGIMLTGDTEGLWDTLPFED